MNLSKQHQAHMYYLIKRRSKLKNLASEKRKKMEHIYTQMEHIYTQMHPEQRASIPCICPNKQRLGLIGKELFQQFICGYTQDSIELTPTVFNYILFGLF